MLSFTSTLSGVKRKADPPTGMQLNPRWVIKYMKFFHAIGADPEARVTSSWWARRDTKIGPGFGGGGTWGATLSSLATSSAVLRVFTFWGFGGWEGP